MAVQIALSNLTHNRARTAMSVAGVGFAIVLIFLQLGFLGSVRTTATLIYDRMQYDIMLRSPDYLHLCDARQIPRDRLNVAASLPQVQSVTPFHVMLNNWQNPQNGEGRGIIVMGAPPDRIPLDVEEVQRQAERLTSPEFVLIDRKTHQDYGPANGAVFGDDDIGVVTDIGGSQVEIAGTFELGTGLAAKGAVLTSEAGFARLALYDAAKNVSMGLVKLRSGADPKTVRDQLAKLFDDGSVEVLTRQQVVDRELDRWIRGTPIGAIFMMGVAISLLVGAAIVYMVLTTDVANHLGEYATLHAMGYTQRYLSRVIMQQALLLAVVSYFPAWLLAEVLYWLTSWKAGVPVGMTMFRLGLVLVLSMLMCAASGLLALRKLQQADPAELF